jgi:putative membrane protein insertion efficiency factor
MRLSGLFTRFLILLVQAYRAAFSLLLGAGKCRYDPTCSAYMIDALRSHGPVRGGWLGLRRLSSCHGWSRRPFHDPVPSAIKPGCNPVCNHDPQD